MAETQPTIKWGQRADPTPFDHTIFDEVEDQEAHALDQIAQCGTIVGTGTAESGLAEHCYDVFGWAGGTNGAYGNYATENEKHVRCRREHARHRRERHEKEKRDRQAALDALKVARLPQKRELRVSLTRANKTPPRGIEPVSGPTEMSSEILEAHQAEAKRMLQRCYVRQATDPSPRNFERLERVQARCISLGVWV